MKRIHMTVLLFAMLLLAGCHASDPMPRQEDFAFTYNGIRIALGSDAEPILEALGEPRSYTEEASCAFDGLDKTYDYGSFYLSTYPLNGRDYVYTIWFADDTAATDKGIHIGTHQSQVEEAYGKGSFNGTNSYVLTRGQSRLIVLVEDGFVSGIRYEAILE